MDKAIVEFYPETPEEIAGLEALWIKMGNCTGDNKKLAPIGTYVPSENKMARFFIEGLAASELPEPEVRAPVDCEVNPEVLGTIFYEGTPLHDGAAIIEDGRVKAAGCVLPLSNNLDLGKDMGTRHRACLGIAENSDAIAIVVSEETGIISMAKNGVLIRHFDRQTLYTRLVDEMIPKEAAAEKSRGLDTIKGQVLSLMDWRKKEGEEK